MAGAADRSLARSALTSSNLPEMPGSWKVTVDRPTHESRAAFHVPRVAAALAAALAAGSLSPRAAPPADRPGAVRDAPPSLAPLPLVVSSARGV